MTSKIVRIFTNYEVTNESQLLGRDPNKLRAQGIRVIFNRSGKADLVLVLNTVTRPRWVIVPKGNLIKVLQEPIIRNPLTHMFTYHHSSIFDQVLTHSPDKKDPRQIKSIPYMGSYIDPTEVKSQRFDQKNQMISVISSTLRLLPGHRTRADFIENLLADFPELESHTFGRGRKQELVSKYDGLRDYRFSIAIENDHVPSLITEKFIDCIISGCVPLYYGAPNIGDFFPKNSYIALPINDHTECIRIINELSKADYEKRIPALIEAQSLVEDSYSMSSLITNFLQLDRNSSTSKWKLAYLLRADGIISIVQKVVHSIIPSGFAVKIAKKIHAK